MTEQPKEITSEILALTTKAERTLGFVKAFEIDSWDNYTLAAEQLKKIKEASRELSGERLGITRPMDEAKKKIMAHFGKPLNFLADAEKLIKQGMIIYQGIQEKLRLEEQKRLDDIAEVERKRLAKIAEEEDEKRVAAAAKAKENPADEPVQDMTAEVVPDPVVVEVVPVIAKSNTPKVKGVSVKEIWYAEIEDPKKILEGVLAGTIPMAAITINQSFFNTQAKSLKGEFNYPGAVAKTKKSIGA